VLGGRPREPADLRERSGEVGQKQAPGGEAKDEAPPERATGGGDGDEAEAQALGVARAIARGQGEELEPGEQAVGEVGKRGGTLSP
jgi:hypothetical protein